MNILEKYNVISKEALSTETLTTPICISMGNILKSFRDIVRDGSIDMN